MHKKLKLPKISDKEAEELAQACRLAFGGHPMDEFMDKVFAVAREHRKRRLERGQQSFAE